MGKQWPKLASLLLIVFLFVLFLRWEHASLLLKGDLEAFRQVAGENLHVIIPFMLLAMLIHNVLPVIPMLVVVSANIAMFGFAAGYVWSLVTSLFCASAAFIAARFWFQRLLAGKVNPKLMAKIERNGFWVVFMARIIPYMPTSIMNAAAGISTISYRHFLLSTMAGNAIFMLGIALISLGVLSVDIEIAALVLLLLTIVFLAVYRLRGRM